MLFHANNFTFSKNYKNHGLHSKLKFQIEQGVVRVCVLPT